MCKIDVKKIFAAVIGLLLISCQTAQEKRIDLVRDRVQKLAPLSNWPSVRCDLTVTLTQPAVARFQQMYPDSAQELHDGTLNFTWLARENMCEVKSAEETPIYQNQKAFLQTALCLLLQVYYVNSPFDELKLSPQVIEAQGEKVFIRIKPSDPSVGILVDPYQVAVTTQTRGHGHLSARYASREGAWLPEVLEQERDGTRFKVEQIIYAVDAHRSRRPPESLWLSVGSEKPFAHSKIDFENCHAP